MYAMLISVEKGKDNFRVKKGKPKLRPKIAIFVKCFLTSDFITTWCYGMFIVPRKNTCFCKRKIETLVCKGFLVLFLLQKHLRKRSVKTHV